MSAVVGTSWEGFVIEQLVTATRSRSTYYWKPTAARSWI